MSNKELYELMDSIFEKAKALAKAKGQDYTVGNDDALWNFKNGAAEIGIDPKKILFIYMNKHYKAITNYIKSNGQSESEPISERIKDTINYLVLLQGLIVEEAQLKEAIERTSKNESIRDNK